ncbi:MAG: VOC family protein [Actinobacteria bacterium]|nr:VOC family protein [Actinomycetota bacterium]
MSDETDPLRDVRELRPDLLQPGDVVDPGVLVNERSRLMSSIEGAVAEKQSLWHAPSIYPRLAYDDERAALEFLTRAFGFVERREARMDGKSPEDSVLAWLDFGDGVVMIGRTELEVHMINSPTHTGGKVTAMLNVRVDDIDAHYERAIAEGAQIVMEINDAFYGNRRYEALDPEGHRWHFYESLEHVKQRRGEG